MRIILASGSPRRRELLEMLKVKNLEIIPAKGEEKAHPELSPPELVRELSRCKAAEVAPAGDEDTVTIGADTIVVLDGAVLGKPRDEAGAAEMLRALSGRSHTVYTGVTVIRGGRCLSRAESTLVHFRELDEEEILRYIATGEPMDNSDDPIWNRKAKYSGWRDKAGGYGIQEPFGMKAVKGIEGDFYNVVGLPVSQLCQMLKELGVDI